MLKQPSRRTLKKVVSVNELRRVVARMDQPFSTIVKTQFYTGLRAQAVLNLKKKDIEIKENGEMLIHVREKGDKIITKRITKRLSTEILRWINKRGFGDKVFNLSFQWYSRKLKQSVKEAGVNPEFSTHWTRAMAGREHYDKNKDVLKLKKFFGHKHFDTTMTYVEAWGGEEGEVEREEL